MVVKVSKEHDVVDKGNLEASSKSKKKMNSNGSSEGNGMAVKDSKYHDGVDEGILEVPSKSKKTTNSNNSSEGNVVAVKGSEHNDGSMRVTWKRYRNPRRQRFPMAVLKEVMWLYRIRNTTMLSMRTEWKCHRDPRRK